jgi:hypothetical protein
MLHALSQLNHPSPETEEEVEEHVIESVAKFLGGSTEEMGLKESTSLLISLLDDVRKINALSRGNELKRPLDQPLFMPVSKAPKIADVSPAASTDDDFLEEDYADDDIHNDRRNWGWSWNDLRT